jgi:hypothetical protein
MSNPSGPDHDAQSATEPVNEAAAVDQVTDSYPAESGAGALPADQTPEHESAEPTEVFSAQDQRPQSPVGEQPSQRRFTAPSGFDAGSTEKMDVPPEPATEVLSLPGSPTAPTEPVATAVPEPLIAPRSATPRSIPPRADAPRPTRRRSWGWVLLLILVIAALAAVAIVGTLLLTRGNAPKVSQEDRVRATIQNFDVAVQKGDLATLRSITCGVTRDSYASYDTRAWTDTHNRVAAAKQYPVVASIDQVVVNGDHAEANVTTFMAYDPQTRSTRSFDLQFRDGQWKICQGPDS